MVLWHHKCYYYKPHIYILLETNSNDANKLASLFANQTELVFKELNNISAITFDMLIKLNFYVIKLVILNMNPYFLILHPYNTIAFYNIKLMLQHL